MATIADMLMVEVLATQFQGSPAFADHHTVLMSAPTRDRLVLPYN